VYEYECIDCEEHVVEITAKITDDYRAVIKVDCEECEEETEHKRILSRGTSFRMNMRRTT